MVGLGAPLVWQVSRASSPSIRVRFCGGTSISGGDEFTCRGTSSEIFNYTLYKSNTSKSK